MIDIILHYKWKYISFLNSDDTYGRSAQQQFTALAAENDICVGITHTISLASDADDYDDVMDELLGMQKSKHATVVILFVQLEMVKNIFSAASRMKAGRKFIWIGSDGWGNYGEMAIEGNEEVAVGSFTVIPSSETLPDFNSYFRSLTPATSDNPWLPVFLNHYGACSMPDDCENSTLRAIDSDLTSHETLVMDAVYAFAYALHSMCHAQCGEPVEDCATCLNLSADSGELVDYLLSTSFDSLANGRVSFTENGDISGRYTIKNLQKFDDGYKFVQVGKWSDNVHVTSETVIGQLMPWYVEVDDVTGAPISVCSLPCIERHSIQIISRGGMPDDCENSTLRAIDSDLTSHETLVMDAVYAFAYALHSMCHAQCGEPVEDCATCLNLSADSGELVDYLLSTSFDSLANGRVSFTENGDVSGRYTIKNLQKFDDGYKFVQVGKWNDNVHVTSETVIGQLMPWYVEVDDVTGAPISVCSLPCKPGERRYVIPDNPCCWECIKCQPFEIVINNNTECSSCWDLEHDPFVSQRIHV
ncbi:metabotropic glutamate receptor-like [Amphiura filiformis]|uniref:metabotropic glutamate receptor-like n=1 Tax=Amphiura filiformis TaxID=82378 RepID=UPI003B215DA8